MSDEFNIEIRPIESVHPYEKNPRINDKAIDAVAASLREFGFRQPIVVDSDGVVIAGHTRLKAAQKLGLSHVPVHTATDLTPEQVKAYRIADNKSGEIAEWDFEILPIELSELQGAGLDMSEFGFSDKELVKLLETDLRQGLTDPDAVPEPPDEAVTRKGDLWLLGDHRLLCGDSAKEEDVDSLLNGATIDICNTDPPYNVRVEPRSNNAIAAGVTSFSRREDLQCERSKSERGKKDKERVGKQESKPKKMRAKDRPLENDFMSDEAFAEILDKWFGNISRVLKPGGSFYIWGGYANLANYPPALANNGLYFSQCIIWNKMHPVLTRKDFMGAFEIAFYGWKEGSGHKFFGPNNVSDLWDIKKVNPQSMVHLTQKPNELAVRALQYSSKPGDHVLELFGGSGSTLMACEQTGRKCFAMEIDTLYCDVIVKRWMEFTGREAVRVSPDGKEEKWSEITGEALKKAVKK